MRTYRPRTAFHHRQNMTPDNTVSVCQPSTSRPMQSQHVSNQLRFSLNINQVFIFCVFYSESRRTWTVNTEHPTEKLTIEKCVWDFTWSFYGVLKCSRWYPTHHAARSIIYSSPNRPSNRFERWNRFRCACIQSTVHRERFWSLLAGLLFSHVQPKQQPPQ